MLILKPVVADAEHQLLSAFSFEESDQGSDYWDEVIVNLQALINSPDAVEPEDYAETGKLSGKMVYANREGRPYVFPDVPVEGEFEAFLDSREGKAAITGAL